MAVKRKKQKGFTLVEILVAIAIIGLLNSIAFVTLNRAREKARVAQAGSISRILAMATEFYYDDMGFYPPDVNRGWDPGFLQPLPFNPDTGQSTIPSCGHCPPDWVNLVQANWRGPYLNSWPKLTPWKGKYDYNYWEAGAIRYGCVLLPGIYTGVQGDYSNQNTIPAYAEQLMINQRYDIDDCINGESQMILVKL